MATTEQTLGQIVTANPTAERVLHRHRLDFCCGGKQSLAEACASSGLDAEGVLREIAAAPADERDEAEWAGRTVAELVEHLLERYHAPLRTELPRLIDLSHLVERAHADKPERPAGLAELLSEVRDAVESHLAKEEKILFPLILAGRGAMARMPVQVMLQEHEDHGRSLRRIRELTADFGLPEDACPSWRELYRSLAELELELMRHIHLENDILFPRALAG
jgi:regulator of cell morphogenesis and NO signaling